MDIKFLGKSLLGIISSVVFIASIIAILLGIYNESVQQNGSGYELAFAGLVLFCLSLWGCRKAIRNQVTATDNSAVRNDSERRESDAPFLGAGHEASHESDLLDSSHGMNMQEDAEGSDAHEETFATNEQISSHREFDLEDERQQERPPSWWYADNREEPRLKINRRLDDSQGHESESISAREDDTEFEDSFDETDSRQEKRGWFGFNDYEEPEWVEEEEDQSREVETATADESDEPFQDASPDKSKESQSDDLPVTTKPAVKPRMRVTAGFDNSSSKK